MLNKLQVNIWSCSNVIFTSFSLTFQVVHLIWRHKHLKFLKINFFWNVHLFVFMWSYKKYKIVPIFKSELFIAFDFTGASRPFQRTPSAKLAALFSISTFFRTFFAYFLVWYTHVIYFTSSTALHLFTLLLSPLAIQWIKMHCKYCLCPAVKGEEEIVKMLKC